MAATVGSNTQISLMLEPRHSRPETSRTTRVGSYTLRPYQSDVVDSLFRYFEAETGNPLAVLPTGAGKSLIQAAFIAETLRRWPGERFLLLTHVKELIEQNAAKLEALGVDCGVYSAGLGRRELDKDVTLAGIQSIYKRAHEVGKVSIVVIDEAHLVSKRGNTMYQSFLADLHRYCPSVRIVGMSATPWRLDSGPLITGSNRIFTDIAYSISIKELIGQGYLSPLVSAGTVARADVVGVAKRGGEFVSGELEAAVDRDDLTDPALDEVEALCYDRKSWLVFCVGVDHARHVAEKIEARGYSCRVVVGDTPKDERAESIAAFKAGCLRALVSVGVLTTGFDAPNADALICLRPTMSPGLWVQMVGRVSRLAPGKANGLVLDFTSNTSIHGPVDQIEIYGDGEIKTAPDRVCENCGELNDPKRRDCESCGHVFVKDCPKCMSPVAKEKKVCPECGHWFRQPREANHETRANLDDIISSDKPQLFDVTDWAASRHSKPGKPDSLRVDYYGVGVRSEWLCFDHGGFAAEKARKWWGSDAPWSVDEALARFNELPRPASIMVKRDGKYWRVVGRYYSKEP